jgi:hypothetical protein
MLNVIISFCCCLWTREFWVIGEYPPVDSPASCTKVAGFFPRLIRSGGGADHSDLSNAM